MNKECARDSVMQEDIEEIVKNDFLTESLKKTAVLVTGATGLIGSQIVKTLACFNRLQNTDIRILAMVRSIEKAERIFGDLLNRDDISLVIGDINTPFKVEENVDYIIHGASATSSKYFVSNPVETIQIAIDGTRNVLDMAKEKKVKGLVYLSSLEVYGMVDPEAGFIDENHYGYIDPLSVRSSYSEGKRMVECLCASYAAEYDIPVKIARLSQTFGAGVEYNDSRVFAEFARCVIEKRDIVLHTQGRTVRTYCYTRDAVEALLYILLKGKTGEAYNVTNMETVISIKDMAQLVKDLYPETNIEVKIAVTDDQKAFGYNPEMVIKLDTNKLMKLGWKPTVALPEMFKRMIRSIYINNSDVL